MKNVCLFYVYSIFYAHKIHIRNIYETRTQETKNMNVVYIDNIYKKCNVCAIFLNFSLIKKKNIFNKKNQKSKNIIYLRGTCEYMEQIR